MTTDPITRLNAALEGRYAIERELGEGGMAVLALVCLSLLGGCSSPSVPSEGPQNPFISSGQPAPVPVGGNLHFTSISAGAGHTCALAEAPEKMILGKSSVIATMSPLGTE